MWFVYIIECKDKSFYTGITTDVNRRFAEHQRGDGGRYTRSRGVIKIIRQEKYASRSAALKREAAIKKLSRIKKEQLVRTH